MCKRTILRGALSARVRHKRNHHKDDCNYNVNKELISIDSVEANSLGQLIEEEPSVSGEIDASVESVDLDPSTSTSNTGTVIEDD